MDARTLPLRLLAALLCFLWGLMALAVLIGYHPGGPVDALVAVAAFLPALVAAAGIVWPPDFAEPRWRRALVWLAITSAFLVFPSFVLVLQGLAAGGRQTLLPSPEVGYGAALALATTSLYVGLGIAQARGRRARKATLTTVGASTEPAAASAGPVGSSAEPAGSSAAPAGSSAEKAPTSGEPGGVPVEVAGTPRRPARDGRVVAGSVLAAGLTLLVAGLFGGVAVANDLSLKESLRGESPFGPSDPRLEPGLCSAIPADPSFAQVEITGRSEVDGITLGTVSVTGIRAREAERWTAQRQTPWATSPLEFARVGPKAWSKQGNSDWAEVDRDVFGLSPAGTLDRSIRAVVAGPAGRTASEDFGLELVGGARARHCRFAVDGPTALQGFVPLRWLASAVPPDGPIIREWRGELDYWIFADSQLGLARVTVSGYPPSTWPRSGLQASLTATLTATHRSEPTVVEQPVP